MIVRNSKENSVRKIPIKFKFLIVVLYFVIVFVLEFLFSNKIFDQSIKLQESMQKIGNSGLKIMQYISILGTETVFSLIFILFYNFANIYKSFVILMVMFITNMITSCLKLIYQTPRPYFSGINTIKSYGCETGFGNPSGHAFASSCFYLTVWAIIFEKTKNPKQKTNPFLNYIFLVLMILLFCTIMISRMFVGAHSLDQIIFGMLLGLGLFVIMRWVLEINTNSSKQFYNFLMAKPIFYLGANLIVIIAYFFYQFLMTYNQKDINSWEKTIREKGCDITVNKSFGNEDLIAFFTFFSNIFAYLGLKAELKFNFNNDKGNWTKINFFKERDGESISSTIDVIKDNQWNHTSVFKAIIRIIVVVIISLIILLPYILIKYSDNIQIVELLKLFLPLSIVLFVLYYPMKILLKLIKLVNYSSLREAFIMPLNVREYDR